MRLPPRQGVIIVDVDLSKIFLQCSVSRGGDVESGILLLLFVLLGGAVELPAM